MEKFKKEIPYLLIALLPFAYLAYIWSSLPERVPMHWNASGEIDRWGDKSETLMIPILMTGLVYVLFLIIPKIDPKGKLESMGNKLNNFRMILTCFMSVLSLYILYSIKTHNADPKMLFPLLGLLFAFLGNYMKTMKPNYFIGFRTPWTLENEEVWRKTHKLGGMLWFVGGLLMTFTFLLDGKAQLYTFMAIIIVISIIPVAYSYLEFQKLKNKNDND